MSRKSKRSPQLDGLLYRQGKDGRKVYQKQPFESSNAGSMDLPEVASEPKVTIYLSMFQSVAWQGLSGNAAKLYEICKMQAFSKVKNNRKKEGDYILYGTQFEISWRYLQACYPLLFRRKEAFYKAKAELLEAGFIKQVSSGKYADGRPNGKRIVYDLSSDWQKVTEN